MSTQRAEQPKAAALSVIICFTHSRGEHEDLPALACTQIVADFHAPRSKQLFPLDFEKVRSERPEKTQGTICISSSSLLPLPPPSLLNALLFLCHVFFFFSLLKVHCFCWCWQHKRLVTGVTENLPVPSQVFCIFFLKQK